MRANTATATTPIKHLVVLVEQGASFDHYFGTYPNAANTDGSPFHAKATTPSVNGLTPALLDDNPNEYNPQRLTHSEALPCDQNHGYTPEQMHSTAEPWIGSSRTPERRPARDSRSCTAPPAW